MIIQHDHTENFLSSVACYLYPTHTMQVYQDSRNRRHSGLVHHGHTPSRKAYNMTTSHTVAGQLRILTIFPTLSLTTSVPTNNFNIIFISLIINRMIVIQSTAIVQKQNFIFCFPENIYSICYISIYIALINVKLSNRVGGGLRPADLSHHRTYRSVYGGSLIFAFLLMQVCDDVVVFSNPHMDGHSGISLLFRSCFLPVVFFLKLSAFKPMVGYFH